MLSMTLFHRASLRTSSPSATRQFTRFFSSSSSSSFSSSSPSAPSSSAVDPQIYDVVCIGGGPAGLAFLAALQSHPATRALKIALIDYTSLTPSPLASNAQDSTSAENVAHDANFSNRCSSLTPSSVRFLQRINAWPRVASHRTQAYHAMDVWDGVSGSKINFNPFDRQRSLGLLDSIAQVIPGNRFQASRQRYEVDLADSVVATMCENVNLTTALLETLNETATGVEIKDRTKVESIKLGADCIERAEEQDGVENTSLNLSAWPIVTTVHGDFAARLLVGADGANSPVRTFADIPSHGWDYDQHGVVATLTLDRPFDSDEMRTAYQRFLPTGTVALLPLPGSKASLVWSTTPALATKLKGLASADFVAMVNAAFRLLPVDLNFMLTQQETGHVEDVAWRQANTSPLETGLPSSLPQVVAVQEGSVASFPLRMRHASTYTGHRVALIGDAAHSVHPLAGQGLNLGLADAEALAQRIAYGVEHGMDIGSCWCLDDYNGDRWAANNAMLGIVDKLQKLYSVGSGPVVWGRSLGLSLVDKLGPVKGMLMNAAAGSR